MQTKWLYILLMFFALASCRKVTDVGPGNTGNVTPVTPIAFSVSSVLQSNMVVQRDQPFTVWGQASPNLSVSVNVSWYPTTINAVTDALGNWKVWMPASAANSSPQTVTIKATGASTVTLTNVVIGDVWVCSGQSNMVFPVDSISPFEGVLNYKAEIAAANYPLIRTFTVPDDNEGAPAINLALPTKWNICSPSTIGNVSAVAYYFAQKLNTTLNIPIGIIISADNGSYCQAWANAEAIDNDVVLSAYYSGGSATLYNGMINPLTNLAIKGFTWYQGENNQHDSPVSNYTLLNIALIKGWRGKFNQAAAPFYYVQLTPFAEDYTSTTPPGGDPTSDYLAMFREAQANIRTLPGTGMAVTMDVGEVDNHHPRNKKPVGQRLALLALKNTYNQNVACVGPQYASFLANGYTATVNYLEGTANGLNTINNNPLTQFFFVAGTDHVFRQAQAIIAGSTVVVTAPQNTPLPIQAIRYAFTNFPVTNLQNSAGLPAEPFRTDNWDN